MQVVTQVGNYGEIFDANLTPLGLERGSQRAVDRRRADVRPALSLIELIRWAGTRQLRLPCPPELSYRATADLR